MEGDDAGTGFAAGRCSQAGAGAAGFTDGVGEVAAEPDQAGGAQAGAAAAAAGVAAWEARVPGCGGTASPSMMRRYSGSPGSTTRSSLLLGLYRGSFAGSTRTLAAKVMPARSAIRFGIETADGAAARQRIVEGHGVMQCTLPMGAVGELRHPVAEAGQRERTQLALIGIEGRQAANEISQEFLGKVFRVMGRQPETAAQAARHAPGHTVQWLKFGKAEGGHGRLRLVVDDQPNLPGQRSHRGGTGVGLLWECCPGRPDAANR